MPSTTRPPRSFLTRLLRPVRIGIRRRPLLPFLLAATIALDSVFAFIDVNPTSSGLLDGLWFHFSTSNVLCQCCLLGVWVVYQWKGASYRLGIAALLLALLTYLIEFNGFGEDALFLFACAGITALGIAVGQLVAHRSALAIPRFRVLTLLQLTTSIAIIATFARYFRDAGYFSGLPFLIVSSLLVAALYGVRNSPRPFWVSFGLAVCAVLTQIGIIRIAYVTGGNIGLAPMIDMVIRIVITSCMAMLWIHGLKVRNVPFRNARKKRQERLDHERKQAAQEKLGQPDAIDSAEINNPSTTEPDEPGPIDLVG